MKTKKKSGLQKKKDNPNSSYYRKQCDEQMKVLCYIRDRFRCIVTGQSKNLNCHHLISRDNYGTRWELNNVVTLCALFHKFSNHMSAHKTPVNFSEWLRINRPEQYEWTVKNSRKVLSVTFKEKLIEINHLIEQYYDKLTDEEKAEYHTRTKFRKHKISRDKGFYQNEITTIRLNDTGVRE